MLFGYDELVCSAQLPLAGTADFAGYDESAGGERYGRAVSGD